MHMDMYMYKCMHAYIKYLCVQTYIYIKTNMKYVSIYASVTMYIETEHVYKYE